MGDLDEDDTDTNFSYLLVIIAVVAHVALMAIFFWYVCRKHCQCRKCCSSGCRNRTDPSTETGTITNHDHQTDTRNNDINRNPGDSNGNDLHDSNSSVSSVSAPHLTPTWLHGHRSWTGHHTAPRGAENGEQPPAYEEGISPNLGYQNAAFYVDERMLPSYQDYVEDLPAWYIALETDEQEKDQVLPPKYDDVVRK